MIRHKIIISLIMLSFNFAVYAEAENLDESYTDDSSTVPQQINSDDQSVFIFNPHTLRWKAYNHDGNLVASGHGSGGRDYCKDLHEPCRTPVGTFYVDGFGGADCLSMILPGLEDRVPMPYCTHVDGDFSIHGYSNVPNYNASHGCIRVKPSEAKWLQDNVFEYGTKVIVLPY